MLRVPRLRIDHLYIIAALAIAGFVVALMPIVPHDFWWHMAIGRDIARLRQIPTVDRYSWSLPAGTPFIYQSWLSELIFYVVHTAGGMAAIVALRNSMLVIAWAILGYNAWRRSGSWRLAGLAVTGLTVLTLNNTTMRPQSFSWIPFALFCTLLSHYRLERTRSRTLLLLPLIMIAWVNLHGAFILGIILLILTAGGESAKIILRRPDADTHKRVGLLWLIALFTVAATTINPEGLGVFGYVVDLLTSSPIQGLVNEWQPLVPSSFLGVIFAGSILLSAGLWLRLPKPADLTDLILWGGFLWLALSGARSVLWWAMIAWPIIAGLIRPNLRATRPVARQSYVNTTLAGLLLLLPLSVQPPFKPYWTLPSVFAGLGTSVSDGMLIAAGTPVQAANWLIQHPLPHNAHLVHDMGFGSYLIWAVPGLKVYVDPRIELYPLPEWLRYKRIMANCAYNRELTQLGATHLMLSKTDQHDLVGMLGHDAAWRKLYDDDQTIIFARTEAAAGNADCTSLQ